jgi:hypothetical protein
MSEITISIVGSSSTALKAVFAVIYPHNLKADFSQQLCGRFGDFVVVLDEQYAKRGH